MISEMINKNSEGIPRSRKMIKKTTYLIGGAGKCMNNDQRDDQYKFRRNSTFQKKRRGSVPDPVGVE